MDRWSQLAALRPAKTSGPHKPERPIREDIFGHIPDAELRGNELGRHIVVRRWFDEVGPGLVGRRALNLLLPDKDQESAAPENWIFLDTETTGLAGGTGTYAFLIGLAWWEGGRLAVEQFFMQEFTEEPSLLFEVAQRLAGRAVLVTYNGKSFDWPLLETRYRMTRTAMPHSPAAHLDLLHPARQIWRYRLNSLALTELERHILGMERTADIPSSLIPSLYFSFLRGGPAAPIAAIFRHNQMDLVGLARLAARMGTMLEDPEGCGCGAAELYGVSRLLQRRGQRLPAGAACERALELGLPADAERSARLDLALLARRRGDFEQANSLWQKLLDDARCGLFASEQLAIHYEHRAHDPARAERIVRDAFGRLRERLLAGSVSREFYLKWHARLNRRQDRLRRLSAKSGERAGLA